MHESGIPYGLLLIVLLAGCAARPVGDGAPRGGSQVPRDLPPDPVPRAEARSRYGNGPIYEVYGQPYQVLPSSYGYSERGVASWYGKKFHGRLTSSQEPYDMHALTAAHKTLPLPTYVEVRNLRNDKSVVVKVNDRGPFVDNRIIDLSYAAARRLDMVNDGTSLVEITAISYDPAPPAATQSAAVVARAESPAASHRVFVQVGAFGEQGNAERRFQLLQDSGIDDAFVHRDASHEPLLYRVRIGPIADVQRYDTLVAQLHKLGIADSHLVAE
jgi:rare lipoprotein A